MIFMNDFRSEPGELVQQQLAAAARVLESGWFILGKEGKEFERQWGRRCGAEFCVGVGNGMDAIEIGLRTLDIGPGAEVITTSMTAFATVLAILRAGATPVLADIDPTTGLLDKESVQRCLSPRTKAVLLVHLYGQIKDMDEWRSFCETQGIHLIEDCAQAHLARVGDRCAGTFGIWGAFSFYPTKNLGAIGDGGALITNSRPVSEAAMALRNYGQTERYHHPMIGLNSRLDEIQAAFLSERLKWLEKFTSRRQTIAQAYHSGISNPRITCLASPKSPENHVYHLFVVRSKERDRLSRFLKDREIENLIHYPLPIHHQKSCQTIARDPRGLAQAETFAAMCLSIPCHPQMSDADVDRVIEALNEYR